MRSDTVSRLTVTLTIFCLKNILYFVCLQNGIIFQISKFLFTSSYSLFISYGRNRLYIIAYDMPTISKIAFVSVEML